MNPPVHPPRGDGARTDGGHAPQLHMVLSLETWPSIRAAETPAGYALRTFRAGDEEAWVALMRHAGFESWNRDTPRQALAQALPDGVFFIEHRPSRDLAATAMAGHKPTDLHPFGGELGWVAVSPPHRGQRLSAVVCTAATRRLVEAGYRDVYLSTDDWRLPAIRTYLHLGYVPLLFAPDMEERWRVVARDLGMRFEDLAARR